MDDSSFTKTLSIWMEVSQGIQAILRLSFAAPQPAPETLIL